MLKGWAITLVVFGHCWRGLHAAGVLSHKPLFHAVDQALYSFHMPLFFFASGVTLLPGLLRRPPAQSLRHKAERLLYPLVLWTYLFGASKASAGDAANTPTSWSDLLILPIPGHWHLWFLWALFLQQMGVLALRPLLQGPRQQLWLWVLFGLACGLAVLPQPEAVSYWTNHALLFLPFLGLGLLWRPNWMLAPVPGLLLGIAVSAALLGPVLASGLATASGILPQPLHALALCWATVQMMGALERMPFVARGLALLGRASMTIYLTHTLFAATLRAGLLKIGITDIWPHLLLGTLGSVALCLLTHWLARRAGAVRALGF